MKINNYIKDLFAKINSSLSDIFPVLEFLNIWRSEMSGVSYKHFLSKNYALNCALFKAIELWHTLTSL